MADYVPLKVKIGLKPNGHALYPDWSTLPLAAGDEETAAANMTFGWKYDKASGHQENSVDSPLGQQWGMIFVTKQFAVEALIVFPAVVSVMTELEAGAFWDDRAHAHIPENKTNKDLLQNLKVELELKEALAQDTTALKARIAKAIDPLDKTEAGIIKNDLKSFADAKVALDITVIDVK